MQKDFSYTVCKGNNKSTFKVSYLPSLLLFLRILTFFIFASSIPSEAIKKEASTYKRLIESMIGFWLRQGNLRLVFR